MPTGRSPTLSLRARGPLACFTRPELKVERVSYPVMTPSAARGLLEAILWKPALVWHVERIHVLSEIRFTAFRRNEVNTKAGIPPKSTVDDGGPAPLYFADEHRSQRNTVALRNVDYIVDAHLTLTNKAGPDDNMSKFVDMFQRRVAKGQHFHQPYLGCREFAAEILPPGEGRNPIGDTRDVGLMLWDLDYETSPFAPVFFDAKLERGVLRVPPDKRAAIASLPPERGGDS